MTKHYHSYLALGDSYTVGEGLPLHQSFPYQLVQLLRENHLHCHAPEMVAQTGWTTFELAEHILHTRLNEKYDFVTLLIGVNNQYRDLPTADYRDEFEFLLKKAIHLAGEKGDRVVVLSIPDWGATAFAKDRDTDMIAAEIDEFNRVNRELADGYAVHYIDITPGTREAKTNSALLAGDKLHYSASEYRRWATELAAYLLPLLR